MEPVKIANGLAIPDNERAHIAAFCFANSATDLTVKSIGHFVDATAEIEGMPVEFRRTRVGLERFTPANFQMFPPTFLGEANDAISYYVGNFRIKNERLAHIAERETDTAPSSQRTAYFHQRYQRSQPASARELKVKRLMVVSLMKHLRPSARVETTGVAVQSNYKIPPWIVDWINNPHLQRFLTRLRLYE